MSYKNIEIFYNIKLLSDELVRNQLMISVILQEKYLLILNETEIPIGMIYCWMIHWENIRILLFDINFQLINICFDFKSFTHLLNSFQ